MSRTFLRLALALAFFFAAPAARAEPIRILVAAASSAGLASDRPLAHTRDDAAAVRDVFTSLGGVAPSKVLFVPDATRDRLFAAIDSARALAAGHDPKEVTLVVYFSGHGDRTGIHLGADTVTIAELSPRLAAVPAGLRIVVVDACRTTAPDREKGMNSEPGFAVSLSSDAATTGTAWLYAAADGQAALESDEIGGAIFTHFWLAGLRGAADANGDGRVTLDESFAYAYAQTLLRSTRSGGVLQRPEAKLELAEASPVVLTQLGVEQATLVLPASADALYLVYGVRSQSVVAEVYGSADHPIRLALAAGRYLVQRREGSHGGAAEILLDARSERTLEEGDFHAFSDDALALKGSLVVHPWSLTLSDTGYFGAGAGLGDEASVQLGLRDASGAWGVAAGPVVGLDHRATSANDVDERVLGGEISVDHFVPLSSSLVLRVGIDARGEWIAQRVTRSDADRLALVGAPATTTFGGAAWGGGVHAGVRAWLSPTVFVDGGVRGLALGAKTDTGAEGRVIGGATLGVGVAF